MGETGAEGIGYGEVVDFGIEAKERSGEPK